MRYALIYKIGRSLTSDETETCCHGLQWDVTRHPGAMEWHRSCSTARNCMADDPMCSELKHDNPTSLSMSVHRKAANG